MNRTQEVLSDIFGQILHKEIKHKHILKSKRSQSIGLKVGQLASSWWVVWLQLPKYH